MNNLPQKSLFDSLKSIFIKEKTYPCIVFDGKKMNYLDLTQKQIDEINTKDDYKEWTVTINEVPLKDQEGK